MSLFFTITGLALGFVVLCRALLVGVRTVSRPALDDQNPESQPELKPAPVRR